ncbi:tetratricopeptide repeat protein [Schinkia azotoformans]|uniref:tetratricopeptide repeat protein n=1 Tax=Schinkia azotoformans TaxID=1454 RepID=UPI002E2275B8|nr:tetratricopeptide repeat protein [Schinkia azotoformans]
MMKPNRVKYILLGIMVFVFIGILYTNIMGKKQDDVFKQDYTKYQFALQLLETNEFDKAINELNDLIVNYPDEYTLYFQLGLAYSSQGDFEKAAIHYQKAIDIRPALLGNQTFTFKMGESLYNIKQFDLAKAYLSNPVPEQFQKQRDELLQIIEKEIHS